MRVALPTVEFSSDARLAISARNENDWPATRSECVEFAIEAIDAVLEDLEFQYLEVSEDQQEDDERWSY